MMKRTNEKKHKNYNWRYILVVSGLFLLSSSLSARVAYLHVIDKEFLLEQADARMVRSEKIIANRGIINDRNGRALAVSTPVVSIWMNPKQLIEDEKKWKLLAKSLHENYSEIENKILTNQNKQFVYLKRHLSPEEANQTLALKINGIYGQTEYRRFYPAAEVAAHVVGLTNIDDRGIEGVELALDGQLEGRPGSKKVVKNRHGEIIKDIEISRHADAGEDITLSIDLRAQYFAYKELSYAIDTFRAQSASAIAIDVRTGEILALVNRPSFNPNNRSELNAYELRNRAVTDLFEPGSTVKPFTVLAALESGKFSEKSYLDTRPGYIKIGSKTIRDHRDYGVIDMTTVITKSSNVATTKMALAIGDEALFDMMQRVGFGSLINSGMPGESNGRLSRPHKGRDIELATMSYGYGMSVTALQLANAYTILANNGVEKPLSILRQEKSPEGVRVIDERTTKKILTMLETVVSEEGTASQASIHGYSVAGKTGTVHRLVDGVYADNQYTSLFAGMAPAHNPRVVLVVVVNNPKGDQYYGGAVAAPVFSKVMEGILRVLDVPPDQLEDFSKQPQVAGLI